MIGYLLIIAAGQPTSIWSCLLLVLLPDPFRWMGDAE